LNRARWDTLGAMSAIRRFAVTRLDAAARRAGLTVGALDEPGQEKKETATAGVKRQHMGCASGIDNDINLVHLAYVRAGTGHALIGSRQWIPAEQISDPVKTITTGLPLELTFATKGELAIDLLADAYADGARLEFVAGDEVYGACPGLRAFLEKRGQAYVLRVRATFALILGGGTCLTCEQARGQSSAGETQGHGGIRCAIGGGSGWIAASVGRRSHRSVEDAERCGSTGENATGRCRTRSPRSGLSRARLRTRGAAFNP
jgi:SRSO17 transposase